LTNFINRANYSVILGHTWSLAVEEHFYLVWPLLFVTLSRKRLFWVSLGVFLVCIPLWIFLKSDVYLSSKFFPDRWTLPAGGAILLGCCLAITNEWPGSDSRRFSWTRTRAFLSMALALYCTSLWIPESLFSLSVFFQLLGIAGVIYWIMHNPTSALTRILEFGPIAFAGKISYGLYIWQGFFLTTGPAGAQIWAQRFPQNLILLVATAIVSFYAIERPFLLMKRQHTAAVSPKASLPAG
jgi:peptidoglycan/LPS O-acetylase OafA/YrhL